MDNLQLRLNCVKKLQKAGFNLTQKAFQENTKYSRFFSAIQKVSDITDQEAVRDAVNKLLQKAKTQFPKAKEVFQEVFAGLNK